MSRCIILITVHIIVSRGIASCVLATSWEIMAASTRFLVTLATRKAQFRPWSCSMKRVWYNKFLSSFPVAPVSKKLQGGVESRLVMMIFMGTKLYLTCLSHGILSNIHFIQFLRVHVSGRAQELFQLERTIKWLEKNLPEQTVYTSKKLQLPMTPWLSLEGEWCHHCVNFASSYKMGNVYPCPLIWFFITFFFCFIAFFFSATSIGWSCWCIRWGEFVWSNNVLFIWGTYHLSELTGRISQFANGLVSCEELRAVSGQSDPTLDGWPLGSQTAHSVRQNWSLLSAN